MVMNSNEENALERIQELFPNDDLRLNDKDPATPKFKTLSRKRSLTASRLQRALSGSKIKVSQSDSVIAVAESEWCTTLKKKKKKTLSRTFLLDCPVRLTAGVQCQERHLFLFTDLLLIAKARSAGNYKLKFAVGLCDLWLADCVDQVAEVSLPRCTSFVIGWPTTNLVVTFSCKHSRDIWLNRLKQLTELPENLESQTTTINVSYWDPLCTKTELSQTVTISRKETAEDCIEKLVKQLENQNLDKDTCKSKYQLWVKWQEEGSCATPYPLIGHERPYVIKMSCLRAAGGQDAFDQDHNHLDNQHHHHHQAIRLCFTLRRTRTASFHLVPPKKNKRIRRAPILQKVFRRTSSKPDNLDSLETSEVSYSDISSLSQPFSSLCLSQDGHLNKTILDILTQLFHKGPYTQGIFRKSANTRARRELCRKLQCESAACDIAAVNAILLSAAITDILRGQSDCLLSSRLYEKWLDAAAMSADAQKRQQISRLLEQIPAVNLLFLKHFVCVLWHIAHKSTENMMTPTNLARCVGPSLLWPKPSSSFVEPSKQAGQCILVAALVEFLILQCREVFGEECLRLFGAGPNAGASSPCQQNVDAPVSRDAARCDSGHEESDSLHSTPSSQDSGNLRRDDSSIDSLENALMSDTDKLATATTNASLTNLSRDSGLTMSDTQLYTADEADEVHHGPEAPHGHCPSYPHTAGREVIKKRVSRLRTWDRPSSSYFASPEAGSCEEDAMPINICKSTSEESLLDDRPYHYCTLKKGPKSLLEQGAGDMARSKSMHQFERAQDAIRVGSEEDWRLGLSTNNYADDDYGSGASSSWDTYSVSPRRPNLSTRTREMYEASVRVYNEHLDVEMHHAAPARVESSHSEEEEDCDLNGLSMPQPPPLPPKPGEALRSYLNAGGHRQPASVVHIGGKSVITATGRKAMVQTAPITPAAYYNGHVGHGEQQTTQGGGPNVSKQRKEGTRPGRFVAATMSKATSMMAAVGREIGLKGVGASKSNSGYSSSTVRRVKCRPSLSVNPDGAQAMDPFGVQGNPPPYRHPPVAPSMSEGPWRTLRSRGVTVHQWQPRRYECRAAEESYV